MRIADLDLDARSDWLELCSLLSRRWRETYAKLGPVRPMPAAPGTETSRAATNELLALLPAGGWRPRAWARFANRTARRSARQVVLHPMALLQLTVLHVTLLCAFRKSRRIALGWVLACTHLGMLGERDALGLANALTLLRAQLPVAGPSAQWWLTAAVASDFLDGRTARATATATPFGRYADPLADVTYWSLFALANEQNRMLRAAPVAIWGLPIAAVTMQSFRRGRMLDFARPAGLRLGAAVQVVLAYRFVVRHRSPTIDV